MGAVKAYELRRRDPAALRQMLEELRKELAQQRVGKAVGSAPHKLCKITHIRKGIARVLTVYNQKRREMARAHFAGKKHKPKDLRVKKTRAIRQRLTLAQRRKMTVRRTKKVQNIPRRKYALLS